MEATVQTETETEYVSEQWGPLSKGPRLDVPAGSGPWRDNAYLCFWDESHDVFGALHVSTSPNTDGRRARLTVHAGDQVREIVEPVESGTATSESITFDFGDRFSVRSPQLEGELQWTPRFHLADYTGDRAPKGYEYDPREPLMHYQRGASVTGHLRVGETEVNIEGFGVRDRTWGFRDESINLRETIGFFWVFPTYTLSAFRLLAADGSEVTQGYRLTEDAADPVTSLSVTRDASGLFAGSSIGLASGETLDARATRRGGHFAPMGAERTGPTHSAYDEFSVIEASDGSRGFGMIEQGVVRQIH